MDAKTFTNASPSPFASAYRELTDFGFHVLPLAPGGKGIFMEDWTRWCDSPPTEDELARFARRPKANIGAAMGSPVGDGTYVSCIDIDVRDDDEVDRIKRAIPHSRMARFGSKGLALLFRAPPSIRSMRYRRVSGPDERGKPIFETIVEVLAHGKQVALPYSIHPETGREYQWVQGPVSVADLTLFDENAREQLEEVVEALGGRRGIGVPGIRATVAQRPSGQANDDYGASGYSLLCSAVNEKALECLSS